MNRERRMLLPPTRAALSLLLCVAFAGCGSQPHLATGPGAPGWEDAVGLSERAAERFASGNYTACRDLLRQVLMSESRYRVLPEAVDLLGRCELAAGDTTRATACASLIERYYPNRISPLRAALERVPRSGRHLGAARSQPTAEPGLPQTLDEPEAGDGRAAYRSDAGGPSSTHAGDHPPEDEPLVSNVFYDVEIQQALADISLQCGIPILAASDARGTITAELHEVPLEECLRRLTVPLGLAFRRMGSFYLVGRADPATEGGLALTETSVFRPSSQRAVDLLKSLPPGYEGKARPGQSGNTITITASGEVVERFLQDMRLLDRPVPEVLIEALVLEVRRDVARELGLSWGVLGTADGTSYSIAQVAPGVTDSALTGALLRQGVSLFGGVADVSARVQALELAGKMNIRAHPRVATLDGQEARIRVGTEAYYSLLSGSVAYSYYTLEKIATGVTLRITPYALESAGILVDIHVEVSDVRGSGPTNLPVTSVREVQTRVQIENGETVAIGGLFMESTRGSHTRVPILGRLPVLGVLFGRSRSEKAEDEVVILITPHLLIPELELRRLFGDA